MQIAVVGAGLSGAVIAHELSKKGHHISVFESRGHIGGNCYSERDEKSGIILHKYGPHIFHTDNEDVWKYVKEFVQMMPFTNRVKTTVNGSVYSMPINLHTINQFFGKCFSPHEARVYIENLSDKSILHPKTFEEQAMRFVGKDLYEAFFKCYTIKQWGCDPKELPASILKRLPVRFNYNDNYFTHRFQGIPKNGYTPIFEKLLDDQNIDIYLNTFFNQTQKASFDHVFYSGPIDQWFGCDEGRIRVNCSLKSP